MQIEQLLPLDRMANAVDAGRRSIGRIDLSGIPSAITDMSSSSIAAARETIPGPWSRPKRRWRWPVVGLLLLMATAVLGMTFIAPMLRRRGTRRPASDPTTNYTLTYDAELRAEPPADGSNGAGALPADVLAYVVEG